MKLVPISLLCPQCGSGDVFYSCNPACCYNHVCNKCYTTFELETERAGETSEDFEIPIEPACDSPTAPCARCQEPKVFAIEGALSPPQFACAACKALLTLGFTDVAPAATSPSP